MTPPPVMASVRGALRTKLLTLGGLTKATVQFEGRTFKPTVGTSYVRETLKPVASKRRSIGPRARIRDDGLYLIDVFTQSNQGTSGGDALAETIMLGFWPGLQLILDGVVVTIRSSSRMGSTQEPDWYMVPVIVSYYFDRINSL